MCFKNAGLRTSDASIDAAVGAANLQVRHEKNDHLGVGRRARVVAIPSWRGAYPVQLISGLLWFRAWVARRRDHAGRMASPSGGDLQLAELVRARFGFGMAPSGVSAAWKKGFDGRSQSPRKGGARLCVANGTAHEATQE